MIRPVDAEISQHFGDNPTRYLAPSNPLILAFGNYQPDGHTGEDYACAIGTPVRAVTDGTVLHIGWMGGTYDQNPWWVMPSFAGYCAVIDHGSFVGIYGHCSDGSAKVAKGDRVTEGQVFILSGNTGGSTGPHLHFEILPDGWVLQSSFYGRVDPEPIFANTISAQSATITPAKEEGFLMALTDKQQEDIYWFLCAPDGREYLAELVGGRAADKTLNTPVKRYGSGLGGETNLAGFLAWNDAHVDAIVNAVSAVAPSADLGAIKTAVQEGLAAGVNVNVSVSGSDKAAS